MQILSMLPSVIKSHKIRKMPGDRTATSGDWTKAQFSQRAFRDAYRHQNCNETLLIPRRPHVPLVYAGICNKPRARPFISWPLTIGLLHAFASLVVYIISSYVTAAHS